MRYILGTAVFFLKIFQISQVSGMCCPYSFVQCPPFKVFNALSLVFRENLRKVSVSSFPPHCLLFLSLFCEIYVELSSLSLSFTTNRSQPWLQEYQQIRLVSMWSGIVHGWAVGLTERAHVLWQWWGVTCFVFPQKKEV